ncbi:hypothetical protein FACS1894200_03550 [Spirochaetia bacterium]|nr:hypothetical protein FACS1894200_03550 [Spirochaetia bacterium]
MDTKIIAKQGLSGSSFLIDINALSQEQLAYIVSKAVENKLINQASKAMDSANIDIEKELDEFLMRYKSESTKAAYKRYIGEFIAYCNERQLNTVLFTRKQADTYILYLTDTLKTSAAQARLRKASVSSFYTHLSRLYETVIVYNPFSKSQGIKDKPAKETLIPTEKDIKIILNALPSKIEQLAFQVCLSGGLRIGALPTLKLNGNGRYNGISKGKELKAVTLPSSIKTAIRQAGLNENEPFSSLNINLAKVHLNRVCHRLMRDGKIKTVYSHHDLRHFFATKEYNATHDIKALKTKLNHSSIAVTDRYIENTIEN